MARFSNARSQGGEGPSSRNPKRLRRNYQPKTNIRGEIIEESANEGDTEKSADMLVPCGNEPLPIILADPEVLDCSGCNSPLTILVFQRENGHLACFCCCTILKTNNCRSCNLPIGSSRCRAIKKVLESVRVEYRKSNYGCKEPITYCHLRDHQSSECQYKQCWCPISDCNFVGKSIQLCQHLGVMHNNSVVNFLYDKPFPITLSVDEKFLVFKREK